MEWGRGSSEEEGEGVQKDGPSRSKGNVPNQSQAFLEIGLSLLGPK